MDIVLDTNIYYSDFLFKSKDFNILFDYLRKTNSQIILPEIVYKEIEACYKRKLEEKLKEYQNKISEPLKGNFFEIKVPTLTVNVNNNVKKYLKFFKDKILWCLIEFIF